jgi:hypothetical protein
MKRVSKFALSFALAAFAVPSFVSAQAVDKPKKEEKAKKGKKDKKTEEAKPQGQFSKEFIAAYTPTNDAYEKAKDYPKAKSLVPALLSAVKNDDEKVQAGRLTFLIGAQIEDIPLQKQGIELALSSATVPLLIKSVFVFQRGAFASNEKNYAAAIPDLLAAYNDGYRSNNVEWLIGNAYQQQNNNVEAMSWYRKMVDAARAKNVLPEKIVLSRALELSGKMRDVAQVAYWGKEIIRAYPEPKVYRDAAIFYDRTAQLEGQESLDLMRLARLNKALVLESDYRNFVESADPRRYPAEATAVINEGIAAGIILKSNSFFTEQLNAASQADAVLRTGWDQDEKTAMAAAKGMQSSLFGDSMLSYSEYARAQKLYEAALAKGGIIDKDGKDQTERTRLRLGIAKAMQGDLAGAKADFAAVNEPRRKVIAEYWLIYLDQKGAV